MFLVIDRLVYMSYACILFFNTPTMTLDQYLYIMSAYAMPVLWFSLHVISDVMSCLMVPTSCHFWCYVMSHGSHVISDVISCLMAPLSFLMLCHVSWLPCHYWCSQTTRCWSCTAFTNKRPSGTWIRIGLGCWTLPARPSGTPGAGIKVSEWVSEKEREIYIIKIEFLTNWYFSWFLGMAKEKAETDYTEVATGLITKYGLKE